MIVKFIDQHIGINLKGSTKIDQNNNDKNLAGSEQQNTRENRFKKSDNKERSNTNFKKDEKHDFFSDKNQPMLSQKKTVIPTYEINQLIREKNQKPRSNTLVSNQEENNQENNKKQQQLVTKNGINTNELVRSVIKLNTANYKHKTPIIQTNQPITLKIPEKSKIETQKIQTDKSSNFSQQDRQSTKLNLGGTEIEIDQSNLINVAAPVQQNNIKDNLKPIQEIDENNSRTNSRQTSIQNQNTKKENVDLSSNKVSFGAKEKNTNNNLTSVQKFKKTISQTPKETIAAEIDKYRHLNKKQQETSEQNLAQKNQSITPNRPSTSKNPTQEMAVIKETRPSISKAQSRSPSITKQSYKDDMLIDSKRNSILNQKTSSIKSKSKDDFYQSDEKPMLDINAPTKIQSIRPSTSKNPTQETAVIKETRPSISKAQSRSPSITKQSYKDDMLIDSKRNSILNQKTSSIKSKSKDDFYQSDEKPMLQKDINTPTKRQSIRPSTSKNPAQEIPINRVSVNRTSISPEQSKQEALKTKQSITSKQQNNEIEKNNQDRLSNQQKERLKSLANKARKSLANRKSITSKQQNNEIEKNNQDRLSNQQKERLKSLANEARKSLANRKSITNQEKKINNNIIEPTLTQNNIQKMFGENSVKDDQSVKSYKSKASKKSQKSHKSRKYTSKQEYQQNLNTQQLKQASKELSKSSNKVNMNIGNLFSEQNRTSTFSPNKPKKSTNQSLQQTTTRRLSNQSKTSNQSQYPAPVSSYSENLKYQTPVSSYSENSKYQAPVSSYSENSKYQAPVSSYSENSKYPAPVSSYSENSQYQAPVSSYSENSLNQSQSIQNQNLENNSQKKPKKVTFKENEALEEAKNYPSGSNQTTSQSVSSSTSNRPRSKSLTTQNVIAGAAGTTGGYFLADKAIGSSDITSDIK